MPMTEQDKIFWIHIIQQSSNIASQAFRDLSTMPETKEDEVNLILTIARKCYYAGYKEGLEEGKYGN